MNPRTFELACSGAFQVIDARTLLPELFAESMMGVFSRPEDLVATVRKYYREPAQRVAMAEQSRSHVLAAHIIGGGDRPVNVVFVADADFASDMIAEQEPALDTPLDNYSFLVNAIEILAGDDSFVRLRNRRAIPRTLTAIESATEPFRIQAAIEQDRVDADIDQKLGDAQDAVETLIRNYGIYKRLAQERRGPGN